MTQHQSPEARPAIAKPARRKREAVSAAEEVIQTSFRLPRSRWKKLQELSIDERASVQSIIISALEAEFLRRGLTF
jgi:hypothetical protein